MLSPTPATRSPPTTPSGLSPTQSLLTLQGNRRKVDTQMNNNPQFLSMSSHQTTGQSGHILAQTAPSAFSTPSLQKTLSSLPLSQFTPLPSSSQSQYWRQNKALLLLIGAVSFGLFITLVAFAVGGEPAPSATAPPLVRRLHSPLSVTYSDCANHNGVIEHVSRGAEGEAYLHPFEFARINPCCLVTSNVIHKPWSTAVPPSPSSLASTSPYQSALLAARSIDPSVPPAASSPTPLSTSAPSLLSTVDMIREETILDRSGRDISVITPNTSPSPFEQHYLLPYKPSLSSSPSSPSTPYLPLPSSTSSSPTSVASSTLSLDDILFIITTTPSRKAQTIAALQTWGRGIKHVMVVSDEVSAARPASPQVLPHLPPDTDSDVRVLLVLKFLASLPTASSLLASHKWFMIVSDLTWVNIPYLLLSLSRYSHTCPIAMGYVWNRVTVEAIDYPSAKAGLILSQQSTLSLIQTQRDGSCSFYTSHDVTLGRCLWSARIQLIHMHAMSNAPPLRSRDRVQQIWLPTLSETITVHGVLPADMAAMTAFVWNRWDYADDVYYPVPPTSPSPSSSSSSSQPHPSLSLNPHSPSRTLPITKSHTVAHVRRTVHIGVAEDKPLTALHTRNKQRALRYLQGGHVSSHSTRTPTHTTPSSHPLSHSSQAKDLELILLDRSISTSTSSSSPSSTSSLSSPPPHFSSSLHNSPSSHSPHSPPSPPPLLSVTDVSSVSPQRLLSLIDRIDLEYPSFRLLDFDAVLTPTLIPSYEHKLLSEPYFTAMASIPTLPPVSAFFTLPPSHRHLFTQIAPSQTYLRQPFTGYPSILPPHPTSTSSSSLSSHNTTQSNSSDSTHSLLESSADIRHLNPSSYPSLPSPPLPSISHPSSPASPLNTPSVSLDDSPSSVVAKLQSNPLAPQVMLPRHLHPLGRLRSHATTGYHALNLPLPSSKSLKQKGGKKDDPANKATKGSTLSSPLPSTKQSPSNIKGSPAVPTGSTPLQRQQEPQQQQQQQQQQTQQQNQQQHHQRQSLPQHASKIHNTASNNQLLSTLNQVTAIVDEAQRVADSVNSQGGNDQPSDSLKRSQETVNQLHQLNAALNALKTQNRQQHQQQPQSSQHQQHPSILPSDPSTSRLRVASVAANLADSLINLVAGTPTQYSPSLLPSHSATPLQTLSPSIPSSRDTLPSSSPSPNHPVKPKVVPSHPSPRTPVSVKNNMPARPTAPGGPPEPQHHTNPQSINNKGITQSGGEANVKGLHQNREKRMPPLSQSQSALAQGVASVLRHIDSTPSNGDGKGASQRVVPRPKGKGLKSNGKAANRKRTVQRSNKKKGIVGRGGKVGRKTVKSRWGSRRGRSVRRPRFARR